MCKFFKTVFIVGLVGLGTFGIACAVLGKARAKDAIKSLQKMAQGEVDDLIAKQKDMKEQLAKLREQYPKQIAALKAQQLDVDAQAKSLDKEQQKCVDILALCDADIASLNKQRAAVGAVYSEKATITHRGGSYTVAEAEQLVARIGQTREIYANRLTDIKAEREQLATEKAQIASELELITAEQQEFEAQYQSLLREIERVKRNQELLDSASKRKGCPADRHSENMETLSQVQNALNKARFEQEERMKSMKIMPRQQDYETRAKVVEIEREREAKRKVEGAPEQPKPAKEESNEESEEEELELAFWVR